MQNEFFNRTIYGSTVTEWLIAVGVAAGAMIAMRLLARFAVNRLQALARKTENDYDDLAADLLARTKILFILLVGIWAGSLTLPLSATATQWISRLLVVGLLFQGAIWVASTFAYFLKQSMDRQAESDPGAATALGALNFLVNLVVWSTFLLLALVNFGVEVGPLLASLGIGGLAVALALQNVLGDLFASLSIILDKPFVIGDFIIVGDLPGTVEHVGLKTTRVRALSGEQLVFGNGDLLTARVRNFGRMEERRVVFKLGVVYGTPADRLEMATELIRDAVEKQVNTRFDRAHFSSFGAFSLDFEVVYFMTVPDYQAYMDTQEAINLELYRSFAEHSLEFAYPTQTLIIEGEGGGAPEGSGGEALRPR